MQMRDSQFGTIVHPSIIKTNNLMMESTKDQKKQNLNNTTIQPISTHLAYGNNGSNQNSTKNDKSPINTRNWRNKSIDTTPDDHYQYSVGKRGGSTAAGDRQHQTIVVASSHPSKMMSQVPTTDYSYNIGPTYQQNQAPRNATKFSDLKFHHTQMDFNKSSNGQPMSNT